MDCKSDYLSQVKDTKTTFQKFRKEWENKIYRGGKWLMTPESFVCSNNFEEIDFVYHTIDANNCMKQLLQKEKFRKKECMQQNFQFVLHIFQKRNLLKDHL